MSISARAQTKRFHWSVYTRVVDENDNVLGILGSKVWVDPLFPNGQTDNLMCDIIVQASPNLGPAKRNGQVQTLKLLKEKEHLDWRTVEDSTDTTRNSIEIEAEQVSETEPLYLNQYFT